MITFGWGQARSNSSSSGSTPESSSSGGARRRRQVRSNGLSPPPPSLHRTHSPVKSELDSKCPLGTPAQEWCLRARPRGACLWLARAKRQIQHQPVPGAGVWGGGRWQVPQVSETCDSPAAKRSRKASSTPSTTSLSSVSTEKSTQVRCVSFHQ